MSTDRRKFLQLLAAGAASAAVPPSIAKALSIPASNATGTIQDVEHIVILMQESRSFDHYFGTLRGVRGFGDPRAVNLSTGKSVFHQPTGEGSGYVLPFHPSAPHLGLQFLEDHPQDWNSAHAAWNDGQLDQFVPQKGASTMAYLKRADIPFHYALADAFTICDAYHSSVLGPTDPNRYYAWTETAGNDGTGGGPVLDDARTGYSWKTFPERLNDHGVTWKVYQDKGEGLDAAHHWGHTPDNPYIGNSGNNALLYFQQYQNSAPGSLLNQGALQGTDVLHGDKLLDDFRHDILAGTLPQVSWLVAPEAYSEHPNWPPNYGAWYISEVLDALTANPEVWSKTVFFLTYAEDGGFFDHVPPPTVPPSDMHGDNTVGDFDELFTGSAKYPAADFTPGPFGLGFRVPMLVISPWSKGGNVDSAVYDHTSITNFIRGRFGFEFDGGYPPVITWRQTVAGDLTEAFNFATPNDSKVALPSTIAYAPPDKKRHPDYVPVPPVEQSLPKQEPGVRPARGTGLGFTCDLFPIFSSSALMLTFGGRGSIHIRSGNGKTGPWMITLGGEVNTITESFNADADGTYDLSVYSANGFFRSYRGSLSGTGKANIQMTDFNETPNSITVRATNLGDKPIHLRATDGYTGETAEGKFLAGATAQETVDLTAHHGWYDFIFDSDSDPTFRFQLAGHIDTPGGSFTDPAIGAGK